MKVLAKLNESFSISFLLNFSLLHLTSYQIYKRNIVKMFQNGAVVKCPGLFAGEVIANLDASHRVITFTMMATNPDLNCFSSVFSELVSLSFIQCILFIFLLLYLKSLINPR